MASRQCCRIHLTVTVSDNIYADLRSFDSLQYFPTNNAALFRVQFDREIRFDGLWELALKSFDITCTSKDRDLSGKNLYIYTNIIDFSFVRGSLKQILKRVSLGLGIKSDNQIIYQMNENENNSDSCYYKRITTSHCLFIEIRLEDELGNIISVSDECKVSLSLHFRRAG